MKGHEFAQRTGAKKFGAEWVISCPAHDDAHPSLGFRDGDKGIVLKCRADCEQDAVLNGLEARYGIGRSDLFNGNGRGERVEATAYDYVAADGTQLFQTVRYAPKTFRQRRPDGKGGWIYDLKGVERVLYRLPDLLAADPEEPVFVCEGEKDVEALRVLGLVATTNPMGAGKWRDEFSEHLRGRWCVILPDNDKAGQEHAEAVARSLQGRAHKVTVLQLPGLPDKGDTSDWLWQGGTADELQHLATLVPDVEERSVQIIPPTWLKPSANRESFRNVRRLPIRFPRLDASWEGGCEVPRLIVAQGPATSGKSGFAAQALVEFVRQGAFGIYVPADSGRRPAQIRIGGILGLDPKILKDGKHPGWAAEWDRFERYCDELGLWITPDSETIETVVDVIERVSRNEPDRVIALSVDSIHRVSHGSEADTPREQIEHVMELLTAARERFPLIEIAVSEVVKSAFRSNRPGENTDSLAAAAESRAIAHAADTILHFSGNPATEAQIHVPKNRDSDEVRFTFSIQARQNRLVEVDASEAAKAREQKKAEREEKDLDKLAGRVLDFLKRMEAQNQEPPNKSAIAKEVIGSAGGSKYEALTMAMEGLEVRKEIRPEGKGWRAA